MWRIPVFLAGFVCAFGMLTLGCVALVEGGFAGWAVGVLAVGAGAMALLSFPAINWVVEGRWGGFYRPRKEKAA